MKQEVEQYLVGELKKLGDFTADAWQEIKDELGDVDMAEAQEIMADFHATADFKAELLAEIKTLRDKL